VLTLLLLFVLALLQLYELNLYSDMFCLDSLLELRFNIEASVGGGRGLFFIVEHTAI
jgi:hypothetical protein